MTAASDFENNELFYDGEKWIHKSDGSPVSADDIVSIIIGGQEDRRGSVSDFMAGNAYMRVSFEEIVGVFDQWLKDCTEDPNRVERAKMETYPDPDYCHGASIEFVKNLMVIAGQNKLDPNKEIVNPKVIRATDVGVCLQWAHCDKFSPGNAGAHIKQEVLTGPPAAE